MADDTGLSDGRDVSVVNFAVKPLLSVSGGGVVTHLLNYSSRISVEIRSSTMQIVFRSRVTTSWAEPTFSQIRHQILTKEA